MFLTNNVNVIYNLWNKKHVTDKYQDIQLKVFSACGKNSGVSKHKRWNER